MEREATETIETEGEFEMMAAGECLSRAEILPVKMLFGEFWLEGDLAVVYGDTSSGKSLLAVQIGESIARGRAVKPFEMTSEPQTVLLLDPARTREQFARRYMPEPESEEPEEPVKPYEFSPNLIRLSLKRSAQIDPAKLAPLIEQTGAKVLIIDSLAHLQRYSVPRETVVVMRELRRLQRRYGLSILVLMNTSRVVQRRGIAAADIPCSSVVTSFADSVFAIGRSGSRSSVRYLKHIKHSSDNIAYGSAHLPYFAIVPRGGNFPSFNHIGYASEMTMRAGDNDHWEWQRIRDIKRLADEGKTIRAIAEELGMSKTTVHRLLSMAGDAPPLPSASAFVEEKVRQFYSREKCIVDECLGCVKCLGRAARDLRDVSGTIINGHDDCPDDCDMCGPRKYAAYDTSADPVLKQRSADHYKALRDWLLNGKPSPKPTYPGARRYGHQNACWKPGSENWTEEQLHFYDRWTRTHPKPCPEPDFNPRAGP